MDKFILFVVKIVLVTLMLFVINIIIDVSRGNVIIERVFIRAMLQGVLFAIIILLYKIINLRKANISIFDKQAFSKKPKISIISTKDFQSIKQDLSGDEAFSFYELAKDTLRFYYREPFILAPCIVTFTIVSRRGDEYVYEVDAQSKFPFVLFDLGSKLKALTLIKSIFSENKASS